MSARCFVITEDEFRRMSGLQHLAFRLYVDLRWRMDYELGVVGHKRNPVSLSSLAEAMTPPPLQGVRPQPVTVSTVRRTLARLVKAGLVESLPGAALVLRLPRAQTAARKPDAIPDAVPDAVPDAKPDGAAEPETPAATRPALTVVEKPDAVPDAKPDAIPGSDSDAFSSRTSIAKSAAAPARAREELTDLALLAPLTRGEAAFHPQEVLQCGRLIQSARQWQRAGVTAALVADAFERARRKCRGRMRTPGYVVPFVEELVAEKAKPPTTQRRGHPSYVDFTPERYAGDRTADADLPAFLRG